MSALAPGAIRPRSSRPSEDVGRSGAFGPAIDDFADNTGPPQRFDHALRSGVSPERHVDTPLQIPGKALHRNSPAGKYPYTVSDIGTGIGKDCDIVRGVVRPAATTCDDRVTQQHI